MSYAVKRFADMYWIEKNGKTLHGAINPPDGLNSPKFFESSEKAWKWVDYLQEGIVDVPRPENVTR
jgi:hypothetical protein